MGPDHPGVHGSIESLAPSVVIAMVGPIAFRDLTIDTSLTPHPTPYIPLHHSLVAPEDRRAYLQSFFRLIFTTTTERQREFIKARPSPACFVLVMLLYACMTAPSFSVAHACVQPHTHPLTPNTKQKKQMFDADGEIRLFLLEAFLRPRPPPALPAFVCRLEPLPKSRHLTLRPEYRATLQALQSDSAAAGPGIGGESSQPPLPPPPPPPPLPVQPGPGALLPLRTGAGTAGGGQGQAAWMADAVAMAASGGSGPGLVPGMASMPLPLAPSGRGIGVVGLTHAEAGATGAERGPTASPVPVGASAAAADAATAAVARGAGGAFSPTALSLHQWVSTEASTGGGPDFGSLARAPIHVRDAATSTQPDPNPDPWHAVAGGGGGQGEGLGMGMGGMPPPRAPSSPSVGLWLPAGGGGGGVGGEGVPVVDFEMLEQVFAEEEEGEEGGGGGGF